MTEKTLPVESKSEALACYTSDEKLRQLAIDIDAGRVFGSWHLPSPDMLGSVFMAIMFAAPDQIPKDAVHVYEYLSEAGPLSVNGMPTFFSAKFLGRDDIDRLQPMLDKLKEARESFLSV